MSQATQTAGEDPPRKRSRWPLILGLLFLVLGGAGGFLAVYRGMVLGPHAEETEDPGKEVEPLPEIAFVPLQPLVVSLDPGAGGRFLHFTAQIEVEKAHEPEVAMILPRIMDVLNTYLRAVGTAELEDSDALVRMRAQMLRRIQLVTGEGRVRDLLVTEFVIN